MTENADNNIVQLIQPEYVQNAIYANYTTIAASHSDFYLGFGRKFGNKHAIFQGHVLLSPQTAKMLSLLLDETIKKYEEQYGNINIEK